MASSGWQGETVIQDATHGLKQYPHMKLDLRIDSISHSGTTLTYKGVVKVICSSGYISYNNVSVSLTGGGTKTINLNLNSSGTATALVPASGTFSCTINNVSATTTTKTVTASLSAGSVAAGSASWTLSFGASTTAPSGLYINSISSAWDSVTGTVGLSSYGTGTSTRRLQMIVQYVTYTGGQPHMAEEVSNGALSATLTVSNDSIVSSAGAVDIKGCGLYYTGVWANNGSLSSRLAGPSVYTPPAPVVFNYVHIGESNQWQVTLTGDPNKNNTDYTPAQLTRSLRYKIDNGSWVNVESAVTKSIDATTIVTVTIPNSSTATIEGWMTYQGQDSEVSTITITNSDAPVHLYGSVSGESKEIHHLYGSVNGRSKKITKLYASVGGIAKLVFEDS